MNKELEKVKDLDSVMLFDAPQTGKTRRTLELCIYRNHQKIVVLIPKNINIQWTNDINLMLPNHKVFDLTLTKNKKEDVYEEIKKTNKCFVITTYHFFANNFDEITRNKYDFNCFVIDEAHNHKGINKRKTIAARIRDNSKDIPYKIALTGTPASNKLLDIWSILVLMFPRKFHSYFAFRQTYFVPKINMNIGGRMVTTKWDTNKYSFPKLKEFIANNSTQIGIEDVYENSTTKVRSFIDIPMPKRKQEELQEIKNTYEIKYEAFTNDLKRQNNLTILSSMEEYFNSCDMYGLENVKFNELMKILNREYKDKKIIVFNNWSRHTEFISEWRKPNWYFQIGKIKEVEEFKKVKKGILFMNPTLAEGQRLSDVDALIFYTIPWTPARLKQAEDRVVKAIKKDEEVIKEIRYVIYEGSNDKRIYELVKEKNVSLNQLSNQKEFFD